MARLSGPNYRTWSVMTKSVIQGKDAWTTIESYLEGVQLKTKGPSNEKTEGATVRKLTHTEQVTDAKARTVIMGYCGPDALSRILHLETAGEQWEALAKAYMPLGKQQLQASLSKFHGFKAKPGSSVGQNCLWVTDYTTGHI